VVVNKWDLVEDQSQAAMQRVVEDVRRQLRHVAWAKIVFTSSTQGTVPCLFCASHMLRFCQGLRLT
jgi:predicted GTPase